LKSGFKSANFIFIPNFQVNNINNPIKQEIISKTTETQPAQLAHIAGKGPFPATKIGSNKKLNNNHHIAI
jgi:hypothetical protein